MNQIDSSLGLLPASDGEKGRSGREPPTSESGHLLAGPLTLGAAITSGTPFAFVIPFFALVLIF